MILSLFLHEFIALHPSLEKKSHGKAAEKYISLIPPILNVAYQQAFGMAAYINTTHLYGNHILHFYVAVLANVSFL